ncbi:MAG TPA: hypothetical protein G4N98_01625 [Thermoflexia bacterium]|nr:hypothetical protein [Thermoflexia bacterium]
MCLLWAVWQGHSPGCLAFAPKPPETLAIPRGRGASALLARNENAAEGILLGDGGTAVKTACYGCEVALRGLVHGGRLCQGSREFIRQTLARNDNRGLAG